MSMTGFPQPDPRLLVFENGTAMAREAARRFVALAGRSVEAGTVCRIALSGGTTPAETLRVLASEGAFRDSVYWPSVEIFWGDERFVPHDHPDSNYGAARHALLDRVPLEKARIHPIPTDTDPTTAAAAYEEVLRRAFGISPPEVPVFDLVFLGMGADGHTASLFPGALPDHGVLAASVRRPEDDSPRVTLTPAVFNAARQVLFLVSGAAKADTLKRVLSAPEPDPSLPATLIRPGTGDLTWFADREAAAWLVSSAGEEG